MSISITWGSRAKPWQLLLACFATGAVTALVFAPFYAWPLLFLCLPIFFLLLDNAPTARQAILRSFLFGYGYCMAGTWWIANALAVDMAKFGWLIPISVLGLSAAMAVYVAVFGILYHRLKTANLLANLLRFVVLWVGIEYLRSIGMFGFPWNLIGYAAMASIHVAQLGACIGVFGLSIGVMIAALLPVLVLDRERPRLRIFGVAAPVILVVAAYAAGQARLPEAAPLTRTTIRIVQPNIPQDVKGSSEWLSQSVAVLNELRYGANGALLPRADVTVWPETAYPLPIRGNRIQDLLPDGLLITGALRVEGMDRTLRLYNSMVAIRADGLLLASYDKHQLVPFGEFVPLRSVLPLEKITPGGIDFTRGAGAETILLPEDLPGFSPLVCYEAIFPWMAADPARRPAWLVNVTNDGWYRDTPGPYQHLAAAQMRSIEQGLPLVRAANTGISAMIDPYGRITSTLAYGTRGVIDGQLPKALPATIYATYGEWGAILLLALLAACSWGIARKR